MTIHLDTVRVRNGPRLRTQTVLSFEVYSPRIILMNPKYPHNVGGVVRAAACYGIDQVWFTGSRVSMLTEEGMRIPREERMRDYEKVDLVHHERPFDFRGGTPVAVEMTPNAESLYDFDHPADAVYVFGPEDGSLTRPILGLCHRFVTLPTVHCLNLSSAVCTVLYDRAAKQARVR